VVELGLLLFDTLLTFGGLIELGSLAFFGNDAQGLFQKLACLDTIAAGVALGLQGGLGGIGEFGLVEAALDDPLLRVEFLASDAMPFARRVFALVAVLPLAGGAFLLWSTLHLKSFL